MRPHGIAAFTCTSVLLFASLHNAPVAHARAGVAADTLATLLDRWAESVGGAARLAHHDGMHLRAHSVTAGVPGVHEMWVTRNGLRTTLVEGADHGEMVRDGNTVWWHDWNGRTKALQGRDLADGVTDAFLRALAFVGPSRQVFARAHAKDVGDDSTHTLRRVRITPPGGVVCELLLDRETGRPVLATRWPYADPVSIGFEDWRDAGGVTIPYRILDIDREGNADTTWVTDATPLGADKPRFERPPDGPSDVRFASGDRALGIPFDFSNDHIMIKCQVNDSKPIWFLLDTGADYNVMNRPRLAEMGLTRFGAATTSGGGGSTSLGFTHVDRLTVGGVTLLGQRSGELDISGLEKLYGMPMGGILGKDFIDRFTIVVDYDRHVLDLYTPGRDAGVAKGRRVPFIIEEGHPHVRGAIVVDDAGPIAADFIFDSGAAESANLTRPFVTQHNLLERARRKPAPAPAIVPGTEKQFYTQTTVRGHLREIRIGAVTVREVPVNLQQGTTGAYASPSFSGTIGQRVQSHFNLTYDYSRSALWFAPNHATETPFPGRTTFGLSLMADGDDYTRFSVAGVRKGSPADSVGFRKGDVIVSLDDKPAHDWNLAGVRAALSEGGHRHSMRVHRAAEPDTVLDFLVHLVSIEDR